MVISVQFESVATFVQYSTGSQNFNELLLPSNRRLHVELVINLKGQKHFYCVPL